MRRKPSPQVDQRKAQLASVRNAEELLWRQLKAAASEALSARLAMERAGDAWARAREKLIEAQKACSE